MRTMPKRTLTGRRDAKPIEHEEDHTVAAAGQLEARMAYRDPIPSTRRTSGRQDMGACG